MEGKNARTLLEQFACQVTRAAVATRPEIQFAWVDLCIGDQVFQRVNGQPVGGFRIHHQHIGYAHQLGDRGEVFGCVKRHSGEQPRVDGMRGNRSNADGQPVWRSFGHHIHPDVPTCAGLVFDEHHTQAVFDPLRQYARRHINGAARPVGHHNSADLVLCPGIWGQHSGQQGGGGGYQVASLHGESFNQGLGCPFHFGWGGYVADSSRVLGETL